MPKTVHTAFSHGAVERIRRQCMRQGMTAWKLSKQSGVSLGVCQRLLAGTVQQPSFEVMAMVAQSLGLSLDYLAGFIPGR